MKNDTKEPAAAQFGGRRFTPVPVGALTVGQELHYMQLYAKSGLQRIALEEGEEPSEFAVRILGELVGAGIVLEMLGTLLLPEGKVPKDWTPEMAKQTAAFLSGLTSEEDKGAVRAHVLTLMLDFFERGLISFWSSRRSLEGTTRGKGQPVKEEGSETIPSVH